MCIRLSNAERVLVFAANCWMMILFRFLRILVSGFSALHLNMYPLACAAHRTDVSSLTFAVRLNGILSSCINRLSFATISTRASLLFRELLSVDRACAFLVLYHCLSVFLQAPSLHLREVIAFSLHAYDSPDVF
jgi:hypothetical protein